MKIAIDSFGSNHGRSGVGSYIRAIVKNLPKTQHEIQLFGHELDKYTYTSDIDLSFEGISLKDSKNAESFWHFKNLNSFIKKQKYDAVIYPNGIDLLPTRFSVPSILVIQRLLSTNTGFFNKMAINKALKNASGIISPTKFIKEDLMKMGVPEEKIKVIYNGLDSDLFKLHEANESDTVLIQPFAIRKPYIIYASRIAHEKKHHVELIKAFSLFKKKYGTAHRLVIAGSDGDHSEIVHKAVLDSGYSADILLTGYFPHESLAQLYASADLCVFPSAIEGVGLPVIEAMACGIPVACANAGALPEIAGSAACYFNPENIEEIADSIAKFIDTDENAEKRNEIIQNGLEWVKQYSWERTASETIEYISNL